jgi:hypothetical protein
LGRFHESPANLGLFQRRQKKMSQVKAARLTRLEIGDTPIFSEVPSASYRLTLPKKKMMA